MDMTKASAGNDYENVLDNLTEYIQAKKISSFNELTKYAKETFGILCLNVVSTKTKYFTALVDSFKEVVA